jgi:hypothetical protein
LWFQVPINTLLNRCLLRLQLIYQCIPCNLISLPLLNDRKVSQERKLSFNHFYLVFLIQTRELLGALHINRLPYPISHLCVELIWLSVRILEEIVIVLLQVLLRRPCWQLWHDLSNEVFVCLEELVCISPYSLVLNDLQVSRE